MDARRQEIIDITICTKSVSELIGDWRILDEPSGSDHKQICFILRQQPMNSWKRKNELGRLQIRSEKQTIVPTRFHNRDQPGNNLETGAAYLSNIISNAFKANYPLKLIRSETRAMLRSKRDPGDSLTRLETLACLCTGRLLETPNAGIAGK